MELHGHVVTLFLGFFEETEYCFPHGLHQFTFPTNILHILTFVFFFCVLFFFIVICFLFCDSHSNKYEVISHCGFDLHFSNDE